MKNPSSLLVARMFCAIFYIAAALSCHVAMGFNSKLMVPSFMTAGRRITGPPVFQLSPMKMAGFGSSDDAKGKGSANLKPKAQWDRYSAMNKGEIPVRVAVRVVEGEGSSGGEWLEVGCVKSEGNVYPEIAVARQRALIAEVGTLA